MHKPDWVHLTYRYSHDLQLIDGDTITVIKRITGSLDATSELTKVIKYFVFLKSCKKNQILSKKGKIFQQVKERQCSRKLWWHSIMPKLLDCQGGIVVKHFRSFSCLSRVLGLNFKKKSRFKSSKSSHRCSNANSKF